MVCGLCAPGSKADGLIHQWVSGTELRSSARAARFLGVSIDVFVRVLSISTYNQEHGGIREAVDGEIPSCLTQLIFLVAVSKCLTEAVWRRNNRSFFGSGFEEAVLYVMDDVVGSKGLELVSGTS